MDAKTIVVSVVSIAIACLFAVTLLIPIVAESTTTEDTFTNEGLWRMKEIENGDVWTRTALDGGGYAWNFDDVQQITDSSISNALLGDDWCIRTSGQGRGASLSGNATSITATAGELVITLTGLSGSQTQSLPAYGVDNAGDYLLKRNTTDTYVLSDSVLYGTGVTNVDSVGFIVHVEGTVKDGVTFTAYTNAGGTELEDVVFSNVKVNAVKIDGYKDLYLFTSTTADITFNTTADEVTTTHTGSVTYNSIVVPYEVTAERSIHPDANTNALLNLIPLLVVVGIILGTVGFIAFRK